MTSLEVRGFVSPTSIALDICIPFALKNLNKKIIDLFSFFSFVAFTWLDVYNFSITEFCFRYGFNIFHNMVRAIFFKVFQQIIIKDIICFVILKLFLPLHLFCWCYLPTLPWRFIPETTSGFINSSACLMGEKQVVLFVQDYNHSAEKKSLYKEAH